MEDDSRLRSIHASAIALNNIGVHFLEKGAFELALASLKNSIRVLQRVTCDHLSTVEFELEVNLLLKQASRQMCLPLQPVSRAPVTVLGYDHGLATFHPDRTLPTTEQSYAIQIEDVTEFQQNQLDIHIAIVLQNLALAHLFFFKMATGPEDVPRAQGAAIEIAMLSCSIVARIASEEMSTEYALGIAALTCLFQNLMAAGRVAEAEDTLSRLQCLIHEEERTNEMLLVTSNVASAA